MPNPTDTSTQQSYHSGHPSRNGRHHQGHHHSQAILEATNPDETPLSPPSTSSSGGNDWSTLTQELVDTVPRVWTRGLLYLLAVFTAIALPWAMLTKVDEVGTARGRLEPKGDTVKLDASVEGQVAKITVKEGQPLKAGQTLIELDSELMVTELQQAQAELDGQAERLSQLELMKNQLIEVTVRTQQQQGMAEATTQLAEIDETRHRLENSQVMQGLANSRLARDMNEVERYQTLVEQGIVAEIQVVEAQRAMDEAKWNLQQAKLEAGQAKYQLQAQQSQYQTTLHANQLTLLETERRTKELESQMASVRTEINLTHKQIGALKFRLGQREIRAPIDGVLFELPIGRPGEVVHPGQMIAQIAPQGVPLVLRADMSSGESGFLQVGMPVKIKFDAYPFQDYGIVEGRVTWVSPNSKSTETSGSSVETFELEVSLDQPHIQTATQHIALTPGQAATAEVIVRQRRIIDFLLDPFKQLQEGGLKL